MKRNVYLENIYNEAMRNQVIKSKSSIMDDLQKYGYKFNRKGGGTESLFDIDDLDEKSKKIINSLQTFTIKQLFGKDIPNFDEWIQEEWDEENNIPQYFIIETKEKKKYLINTEGYNYCRYVLPIQ